MNANIFPNTFIIGVHKAGTTSLNDWLAQHPEIYCYKSLKDFHLFFRLRSDEEIVKRLRQEPEAYKNQPAILQTGVNYIFYNFFLQKIATKCPSAKLIVILRNPVKRAFSAYDFHVKMNVEKRSLEEALLYEPEENIPFSMDKKTYMDNTNFSYIEHGLYYRQLSNCYKYFSKEQVLILDYEDLKERPLKMLQDVFSFLNVDASFSPQLTVKNVTGSIKNESFQKILTNKSKTQKFVLKYFIDSWLPPSRKEILKQRLLEFNTSSKQSSPKKDVTNIEIKNKIKRHLNKFYKPDTLELDKLISSGFFEKWFKDEAE